MRSRDARVGKGIVAVLGLLWNLPTVAAVIFAVLVIGAGFGWCGLKWGS